MAPIGLSPLPILTLCGSKRVLVVSTEPLDDLSRLTTPGAGRRRDGLLPAPLGERGAPLVSIHRIQVLRHEGAHKIRKFRSIGLNLDALGPHSSPDPLPPCASTAGARDDNGQTGLLCFHKAVLAQGGAVFHKG